MSALLERCKLQAIEVVTTPITCLTWEKKISVVALSVKHMGTTVNMLWKAQGTLKDTGVACGEGSKRFPSTSYI